MALFLIRPQGDVSNRGRTRSSKAKGRAGAARTENPAEETLRQSNRTTGSTATNEISVLEEVPASGDKVPKRRRSLRSCVLAQTVNNDEDDRSSSEKSVTNSKSKATAKKAKGKDTQARGRSTKRRHEEEAEAERETKKQKRSTSKTGRAAADKKSSKSSRDRKRSTSRGSRKISLRSSPSSSPPRKLCSAFLTETNYGLVRTPFDSSKFTLGIAPHDEAKKDDVLEVSDYATDIFQRLYFAEVRLPGVIHNALVDSHLLTFSLCAIFADCCTSSAIHGRTSGDHTSNESHSYRLVGRSAHEVSSCPFDPVPMCEYHRQILLQIFCGTKKAPASGSDCSFACLQVRRDLSPGSSRLCLHY